MRYLVSVNLLFWVVLWVGWCAIEWRPRSYWLGNQTIMERYWPRKKSMQYCGMFIGGLLCDLAMIACRIYSMALFGMLNCFEKHMQICIWNPSLWRHNGCGSVSNHRPHDCLINCLFRRRSKKTSKLRVTGLCAGNSPGTGEFPAQRASKAENVSIWWRHHAIIHGEMAQVVEIQNNAANTMPADGLMT